MTRTFGWAESLQFLQSQVIQVEEALAVEGLYINGDKTECVCSHLFGDATITVGGQTVSVKGPSHVIKVLGAIFPMGSSVSILTASMQQQARAVLASNKATFRGDGALSHKAAMADILIRPAALWGCGTWPCHAASRRVTTGGKHGSSSTPNPTK